MYNIISQISNLPLFKKIDYIENINLFKEKLPKTIKKHIIKIYQKEKKLFIIVDHPAITTELNHKKRDIMFMLKLLQEHKKIFIDIKDIIIFHTNKLPVVNNEKSTTKIKKTFNEKSKATFINNLDDIALYNKMETIRNIIVSSKQ
jgi:hypothetical protein